MFKSDILFNSISLLFRTRYAQLGSRGQLIPEINYIRFELMVFYWEIGNSLNRIIFDDCENNVNVITAM